MLFLPCSRTRRVAVPTIIPRTHLLIISGTVLLCSASYANAQSIASTLSQERAAARKAGLTLSADALSAPMPPPNENAAPLYEKLKTVERAAISATPPPLPDEGRNSEDPEDTLLEKERRQPDLLTPAEWMQIQQALTRRAVQIALIRAAAQRPKCVLCPHEYVPSVTGEDAGSAHYIPAFEIWREAERLRVQVTKVVRTPSYPSCIEPAVKTAVSRAQSPPARTGAMLLAGGESIFAAAEPLAYRSPVRAGGLCARETAVLTAGPNRLLSPLS